MEAVVDSFYSVDAPVVVYDEKAVDYAEVDPKERESFMSKEGVGSQL